MPIYKVQNNARFIVDTITFLISPSNRDSIHKIFRERSNYLDHNHVAIFTVNIVFEEVLLR